jgi:hypothetical protein
MSHLLCLLSKEPEPRWLLPAGWISSGGLSDQNRQGKSLVLYYDSNFVIVGSKLNRHILGTARKPSITQCLCHLT